MTITKINKLLLVNEGDEFGTILCGKYLTDIHLLGNGLPLTYFH